MKRIRILLADEHAVVRQGFKMILGAQSDMEIVGEAGNGREAVELAEQLRPDVIVMDVAMPELNGIEATRRLASSLPHTRVVALSMHKDSVYVREILRAGARGYLLKDSPAADSTTRSTRRLCARPSVVSLVSAGALSAYPATDMRSAGIPNFCRSNSIIEIARAAESSQLLRNRDVWIGIESVW